MSKTKTIILCITFFSVVFCSVLHAQEEGTLFALPVAFYSTDTGFGTGAALIKSYRQDLPRSSTFQFLTMITTKKQFTTQFKNELYLRGGNDRLVISGEYEKFPTDFFGLGNATSVKDPEKYTPETFELEAYYEYAVYKSLKLRSSFKLVKFAMIETEDNKLLESGTVPWRRGRFDAGPGIGIVWDSRDNTIASTRGIFAKLHYNGIFLQNRGDAYNTVSVDLRNFFQPIKGFVFASQCKFENRQGDVPFYRFTGLGGQDHLRGYDKKRFSGKSSILFQQDVRFPLYWRLGGAVFAAAGKVADEPGNLTKGRYHAIYGIGGRFSLNEEENLVLRADYAKSTDSTGFYITFGEAF